MLVAQAKTWPPDRQSVLVCPNRQKYEMARSCDLGRNEIALFYDFRGRSRNDICPRLFLILASYRYAWIPRAQFFSGKPVPKMREAIRDEHPCRHSECPGKMRGRIADSYDGVACAHHSRQSINVIGVIDVFQTHDLDSGFATDRIALLGSISILQVYEPNARGPQNLKEINKFCAFMSPELRAD